MVSEWGRYILFPIRGSQICVPSISSSLSPSVTVTFEATPSKQLSYWMEERCLDHIRLCMTEISLS